MLLQCLLFLIDYRPEDVTLIQGYYIYRRYKSLEEDLTCKVCRSFVGLDDGSDLVGHFIANHLSVLEAFSLQSFAN